MDPIEPLPLWRFVVWSGLIGLAVGSFLNVVIHRLPLGESIVRPRSNCPGCGRQIRFWENVPLLSFAIQRGRCNGCGAAISVRYPIVELLTGLLFAAIAWRYGAIFATPLLWALAASLVAAGAIDFDHRIIPDEISLGGLAVALLWAPAVGFAEGMPLPAAALRALLGALVGGGSLWLVGFVHARLSVALGREFEHWPDEGEPPPRFGTLDYWTWFPGVGFGDVKLLAMIGAVLGPLGVIETILVASLAGLLMGLVLAVLRGSANAPFGFAPAIGFGAIFVVLSPIRLF